MAFPFGVAGRRLHVMSLVKTTLASQISASQFEIPFLDKDLI
jgi:hypothetical protein